MVRLKQLAAGNAPRWVYVKKSADGALTVANPTPLYIAPLALSYKISGNTVYAQKAIQIMLDQAVDTNLLTRDSCYDYRTTLPNMAAGFDWLYELLTPAQRKQIAHWLMDRADYVWPETNPARVGGWGVNKPGNNYYYGFLMSWPAALAVYGDDDRAAKHIELGLRKFRTEVRPFTDGWGAGGLFPESTNYDSTFRLALILAGHQTATGEDLINEPGFSFISDSINWRVHATVPKLDAVYPLGDQPRVSSAPLSPYDRERALVPGFFVNDPATKSLAKTWLDSINPNVTTNSWWWSTTWEFLFYDSDGRDSDLKSSLPLSYYAPGPGILLARSSWTPDATYWGIWAGPLREGHQNYDVNGFKIYKGGWLVADANIYSASGILAATSNHNNFTFSGTGQGVQVPSSLWPDEAGKVLNYETAPDYTYFAGQGAQAYVQDRAHKGVPLATDYVRKWLYAGPDTFFIYDRVSLVDGTRVKEWHLHSQKPISIKGRQYVFDNGQYKLYGASVLPSAGVTVTSTPELFGNKNALSSYRLDVNTSNGNQTDWMLNVLRIAPVSDSAAPVVTPIVPSTGSMEGALLTKSQDAWAVLFGKSELVNGPVAYQVHSGASTRHVLTDLLPNTTYAVTAAIVGGSTLNINVMTSPAGILEFMTPGGQMSITAVPKGTVFYSISGTVFSSDGKGLPGVSVSAGGITVATAANGTYSIGNLAAGAYTVAVSKDGTAFNPSQQSVTLGPSKSDVDFTAVAAPKYSVSGTVRSADGKGLAGASVSAGGVTVVSTSNGTYSIGNLEAGTYTVSVSSKGLTFNPSQQSVTLGPSKTGVDFKAGAAERFSISGTVKSADGKGLPGVSVSAGGITVTTAANGTYSIDGIAAGTYAVVVSSKGLTFNPSQQSVTVGPSKTGINFTAVAAPKYSVSGTVRSADGKGLAGASVSAGGVTVVSTSNGTYSIGNLEAGTYTVSVSSKGLTFNPSQQSVTLGPSKTGVDFKAGAAVTISYAQVIPGSVKGGTNATGRVVLTANAPAGGLVLSLASNMPDVMGVQSTVTVPAGAQVVTFPLTTSKVKTSTMASFFVTLGECQKYANLKITP